MAKLEKLRQVLEKAVQGSALILDTADNTFPAQLSAVKNFLSGVLSASQLTLVKSGDQPLIDTSETGKITVVGKAQLFDLPKVELTLVFTEPGGKLDMNATVKVLPEDKVKLPNMADFFDQFLEKEMVDTLPEQLMNLPTLTVNSMLIEIGPKPRANSRKKTVKQLSLDLRANANVKWELVPGFLATKNNQLQLDFKNLTDPAKRRVSGTIQSTLKVGPAGFDFLLEKRAVGNKWTMKGSLAAGQKLPLADFAGHFLKAFALPADLPAFDIDEATFTLDMLTKKVTFASSSSEGLEIVPGYGVNQLGVGLERSPGAIPAAAAQTAAALTGTILAAEIDLNLRAEFEPKSSSTGKDLTFEGSAAQGAAIPIGKLVSGLAAFGGVEVPASIEGAEISDLTATFLPDKKLTFGFLTTVETDLDRMDMRVDLTLAKNVGGGYDKRFDGLLTVGDLAFETAFSTDPKASSFYASLRPGEAGEVSLSDLLARFVEDPNGVIPVVSVGLENAFVSFTKPKVPPGQKAKGTLLVGVSVSAEMSFGGGIPLVGSMLNGQAIEVDTVLFTYATAELKAPDLRKLNLSLPKGKPKLPEVGLQGGIGLSVSMAFGKLKQFIALPVAEQQPPPSPGAPPPPPAKPEKEGKWFPVNKRMGPLSIGSVGINFKDSVLNFGLEATLALGPLTLALEELTLGSRLDRFEPQFGLRGFGLGWSGGPVEISGFFLRKPENNEFIGAALIKTPTVTLKAIGAFAMVRGEPSFFLYAYLGYPIGGPAFFFVEGLAAGFGFNRSVAVPSIDKVKPFPLVAIAIGEEEFLGVARRMATGNYVPIDLGKLFLAVGVRFTTFKQLDSFLLLIATFGDGFRLDLLGLSKLTIPSPGPQAKNPYPLAEIELAIKGTFAPSEGFVGVEAQLTRNSYILSRDCYLTGGFAFYTWFDPHEKAGDFVISIGGYHPKFKRPGHYPVVPRLGFNWQVSSLINVKGGMYFALTPSVVMAGGRLEATFRSGGLKAWFIIGADFIIGWKPYFYDARLYMSMGVSYTFWFFGKQTVSFDIGAALHIWGPEFSGTAYIDLGIVDFTVEFGAGASQTVQPIRYAEFKKSFLPAANVATVAVTNGLLKEVKFGNEDVWVINPKSFSLATDSAVPSKDTIDLKKVSFNGQVIYLEASNELFEYAENPAAWDTAARGLPFPVSDRLPLSEISIEEVPATAFAQNLGIGTVGVKTAELATSQGVKIFKGDDDFTAEFIYEPRQKSYPAALWGSKLIPDKNDKERVIPGVLSGLAIKPLPPSEPDQMGFLDQSKFKFQTLAIERAFQVGQGLHFSKNENGVNVPAENADRTQLLEALGFASGDFELDETTDFGFAEKPVVGAYEPGVVVVA